jgi:hypothetical protein
LAEDGIMDRMRAIRMGSSEGYNTRFSSPARQRIFSPLQKLSKSLIFWCNTNKLCILALNEPSRPREKIGETMKKLNIPALAILIAIAFIAQPVAVCVAQNWDILNSMRGHRLHNLWGNDLGRVECVTSDDYGQPAFIVLSVMDNKIVAIPFSALTPSSRLDNLVVNITRGQLRNSSGYSINAAYAFCRLSP